MERITFIFDLEFDGFTTHVTRYLHGVVPSILRNDFVNRNVARDGVWSERVPAANVQRVTRYWLRQVPSRSQEAEVKTVWRREGLQVHRQLYRTVHVVDREGFCWGGHGQPWATWFVQQWTPGTILLELVNWFVQQWTPGTPLELVTWFVQQWTPGIILLELVTWLVKQWTPGIIPLELIGWFVQQWTPGIILLELVTWFIQQWTRGVILLGLIGWFGQQWTPGIILLGLTGWFLQQWTPRIILLVSTAKNTRHNTPGISYLVCTASEHQGCCCRN